MRVDDVYVRNAYRSAGVGRKLMEAVFEIIKKPVASSAGKFSPPTNAPLLFMKVSALNMREPASAPGAPE